MIPYSELVLALRDWRTRNGLPVGSITGTRVIPGQPAETTDAASLGAANRQTTSPAAFVELPVDEPAADELPPIEALPPIEELPPIEALPPVEDEIRPTVNLDLAAAEVLVSEEAIAEVQQGETYVRDEEELMVESVDLDPDAQQDAFVYDEATVITNSTALADELFGDDEPTRASAKSQSNIDDN